MKTRPMTLRLSFFLLVLFVALAGRTATAQQVAVIVHVDNPISKMSASEVKQHFLKKNKKAWANGEKIRPVDRAGNPDVRATFLADVLDMSTEDAERYWMAAQYSKAQKPPQRVDDEDRVIKLVGAFKGGIGFISADALTDEAKKSVKAILVVD